ncbi:ABC transporter ATP-binding protein [Polynucleobacter paneuropaeus]|nr:ABC transporter ATP-binding protein [Polynucleobacter paneuropaeus]
MLGLLTVVASFAEVMSIGSVLPFLAVLTTPESIVPMLPTNWTHQIHGSELLLWLTIFFILATLFACMIRLLLAWSNARVSYMAGADIGVEVYKKMLYQPYEHHVEKNSSETISVIATKTNSVTEKIIFPTVTLLSSAVMLLIIMISLFIINHKVAFMLFGTLGLIYFFIIRVTKDRLKKNSQIVANQSQQVIQTLQEGLGGIRDVLIDGSQEMLCKIYQKADYTHRTAQSSSVFISFGPRFIIEAIGIIFIAFLAYFLNSKNDQSGLSLAILGTLAIGAQRSLPIMQQAFLCWANIRSENQSLREVLTILDYSMPLRASEQSKNNILKFEHQILIKNVSFRYQPQLPWVLNEVNFKINKGDVLGLIGETGSGKSTLVDLIMGLLLPNHGCIEVDGVSLKQQNIQSWQKNIAHVPQTIFLLDGTIAQNIAFGIAEELIDRARLQQVIKLAQLDSVIEGLPKKMDTPVGERGVRLSGGQRQRIGIARALYKGAQVLVLDEATSALDAGTEERVMKMIEAFAKEVTVIIIAHRLSTLKNCSRVIEVKNERATLVENFL